MARKQDSDDDDVTPSMPDFQDPEDKPLIAAAKKLKKAQKAFGAAGEDMKEAQESVKTMMHERQMSSYHHGSIHIELTTKEKLKVSMDDE